VTPIAIARAVALDTVYAETATHLRFIRLRDHVLVQKGICLSPKDEQEVEDDPKGEYDESCTKVRNGRYLAAFSPIQHLSGGFRPVSMNFAGVLEEQAGRATTFAKIPASEHGAPSECAWTLTQRRALASQDSSRSLRSDSSIRESRGSPAR